jgi:gas vesicle protein
MTPSRLCLSFIIESPKHFDSIFCKSDRARTRIFLRSDRYAHNIKNPNACDETKTRQPIMKFITQYLLLLSAALRVEQSYTFALPLVNARGGGSSLGDSASEIGEKIGSKLDDGAESIKDAVHSGTDKSKSTVQKVKDTISSGAESVKDAAVSGKDKVKDVASSGVDKVKDAASSIKDGVKDAASSVKDGVKDAASSVKDFVKGKADEL